MTALSIIGWLACSVSLWLGGVIWGRNGERRRWLNRPEGWCVIPTRRWP